MRDHEGSKATLARVEVTEARKSLGIMIAGDCNWKAEETRLLRASVLWKAQVQFNSIQHNDCTVTLRATKAFISPLLRSKNDRCRTTWGVNTFPEKVLE
jgi:hypothetical protein